MDNTNDFRVNPEEYAPIELAPDLKNYLRVDYIVNKSYLPMLGECEVVPCPDDLKKRKFSDSACFFQIEKIVYDQEENNLQKLANVYACASIANINVGLIIKSSVSEGIKLYMGACNEDSRFNGAQPKAEILYNCFIGNFPGSRSSQEGAILSAEATDALINSSIPVNYSAVASVSGVASLRGQQNNEKNVSFYQGIEKVVEAMNGRNYTIIIIAKALQQQELNGMKCELESLYTKLSPFARSSLSVSQSNGDSVSRTLSDALSDSVTNMTSDSLSVGNSHTISKGTNTFTSINGGLGINIGGKESPLSISPSVGIAKGKGTFDSVADTVNETNTNTKSLSEGRTTTITTSDGKTVTVSSSQSVQLTYENKEIIEMLASIELQLKRLKTGSGLGMFATSTYFAAPTLLDVRMGASAYKASISGDNTYVEKACVNVWKGKKYNEIMPYLRQMCHPVFLLNHLDDNVKTTPATVVAAPELAIHMSLPKKSVNNIPIRDSVSFGRNTIVLNGNDQNFKRLPIGHVFHLGHEEETSVDLDFDSLTMHTFITGTTGSGKSNTVYGMIEGIWKKRKDVHFLVVEPAKGEYKTAFADKKNVAVYGVNPYHTPLLRINPFRFRKGVHILEHLDRLVSIFNVCWPMEAAMPAIMKQALERAYISAGWNLRCSTNEYSEELFPTFSDVMQEVEFILDESQYSSENKGDYIGALCTRLQELTTGLNGVIFVPDDISDRDLFERNVIIDLSRIGSPETKSLLMGLIVIRLQEYRQTMQESIHSGLKHITVLEEAHHLLKRTSTEQSMDSANLTGKSVEMLTNALAEMRSAGEGFIIADQAPGLMDMSVIRNTNTKIVMRLPAAEDRELVGKAIGLNDLQIIELAKLPTGVAAVYQNDWLDAVLVKIPYYETGNMMYQYALVENESLFLDVDEISLLDAFMHKDGIETMVDQLKGNRVDAIARMRLTTKVKRQLINYVLNTGESKLERLGKIAFDFFNMKEAILQASTNSLDEWKEEVLAFLEPSIAGYDKWDQDTLLLILGSECARRFKEFEPIYISLVQKII